MDPNQIPPQQPSVPPAPAPIVPEPAQPYQPVPQPQQPMPPQPAPVPVPPPQVQPTPMPQQPTVAAPQPFMPQQAGPAGPMAQPPAAQFQQQPVTYGASAYSSGGGIKKFIKPLVGAFALIIILFVGYVLFGLFFSSKVEVSLGEDYIAAVQNKDAATVEKLIDPEVAKVGKRLEKIQDSSAKESFYDELIASDSEQIGQGTPTKKSVKVSSGGKRKHAVVVFNVGSGTTTIVEIYDDAGNPSVVGVEKGTKGLTDKQFDDQYTQYQSDLKYINDTLDAYEDGSSQADGSATGSVGPLNSLFQKQ